MNTRNFSLRKILDKDIAFGDFNENMRAIENDNADIIDEYLAGVMLSSVSSNLYTISATEQMVYAASGTPTMILPLAASLTIGKMFMVANNTTSTISVVGQDFTINSLNTLSVGPNYKMKTIIKATDKFIAY